MSALTATAPTALDYALAYARRGWRVVPTRPGGKRPIPTAWQTEGTTDTARITHWWTQAPDNSISIVTGAASGIWVLDVDIADDKHGDDTLAELEATHGPLPDTWEVVTGSGGRHLYFAWPDDDTVIRNSASGVLGPGLDVRGEGGQVIAPPSLHANGTRYARELACPRELAHAPAWLVELLTAPHDAEPAPRTSAPGDRPGDEYAAAHTWAQILTADGWTLDHTDPDGEEHWIRPGKTAREGTGATVGYKGNDTLKVFTSSVPYLDAEQTYSKLGYLAARDHGGDLSAAASALRAQGYGATGPNLEDLIAGPSGAAPGAPLITDDDIAAMMPQPINWATFWDAEDEDEWLIEPVIPASRHTVLFAPAKMGKSLLALEIAVAAATGRRVLGQAPRPPVKVVYLDFEMTESDVRDRLGDMNYAKGDELDNLAYYSLPSMPLLDTAEGGRLVLKLATAHDANLVVIDTMARVVGGEENSADTYRMFDLHTSLPLKRAGIAVLRLDHAGKDLERGQRGSSEKNGYADLVWSLIVTEAGQTTLRATHRRIGWAPTEVKAQRMEEPLRHEITQEDFLKPGVVDLVRLLDEMEVDPWLSLTKTNDVLKAASVDGKGKRKSLIRDAQSVRKREADVASMAALSRTDQPVDKSANRFPEPVAAKSAPIDAKADREPITEMASDLHGNRSGTGGTGSAVQPVPNVVPPIGGTTGKRGPIPDGAETPEDAQVDGVDTSTDDDGWQPGDDPLAPITAQELNT